MTERVALISGASRGIGRAAASKLAADGAQVALVGRDAEELKLAAAACPGTARPYVADVTNEEQVNELASRVAADLGPVDILVNNAGVGEYGSFLELEPVHWRRMLETNLLGAVHMTRAALPSMLQRQSGWVVNVASRQALEPPAGASAYSASKAGLVALSRSLAQEVADAGIRVCVICPGGVATDFAGVPASEKPAELLTPETVADVIVYACSLPPTVWVRDLIVLPMPSPQLDASA